jgi:DNA polymerase-3 subunit delta'
VRLDYAAAIAQRVADNLLYPPASGSDGIFVATVRAIVKEAGMTPAMGRRKVFVIGNAERMVPQEGTDQAANAFLKLLEEPAANTTLILTTSEPAALLPTIRSRLISFRMNKLADSQLRGFLHDPLVAARFDNTIRKLDGGEAAMRAFLRGGAPGALIASESARATFDAARSFLRAAGGKRRSEAIKASFALGATGARGGFTEFLDALSELVHQSMQASTHEGNMERVSSAAAAIMELQNARQLASGNITPQLLGIRLLRALEQAGV